MRGEIAGLCRELCCQEVSAEEELIMSGLLDSFKIMELISSLEEKFHIVFNPEEIMDLDHFSTINHIAEIVSMKTESNC